MAVQNIVAQSLFSKQWYTKGKHGQTGHAMYFSFAIYMQKFNNIAIPSQPAKNMPNDSNLSIAAFQLLAFSLRKTLITGFLDNNITYIDSSKQRNDMLTQ